MHTLIIGGGLSGLSLATQLHRDGHDFLLLEARDRLGGRILTQTVGKGYFDLGPGWFWPGQPRIAALIAELGLKKFDQHYEGILTFEDENGVQHGRGHASMQGSYRLEGGLGALIDGLANTIPADNMRLNAEVTTLEKTSSGITAKLTDGTSLNAQHVVLALPPRVAAEMAFTPALPTPALRSMTDIPTWMAGQAKAVAVYETPFWRAQDLSGDAMSRVGPMVEIHDASPADGRLGALFGFIGVPPEARQDETALRSHVTAQLTRLFGPQAAHPKALFIKDWAADSKTATQLDLAPMYAHPTYSLPSNLKDPWGGCLSFSGTEVAPQFGGFLEGALEAAEASFKFLQHAYGSQAEV
ncbi:amine oxidase [Sulfitobacter sp. SK012]|uniref:flavin monoamine oxidase family protein n=1 Tax=Sulfitobacter sp. SK012 TaxID=1389005 RepID=UPI000E0A8B27|nr:NAD(P)/FAD-dependent oxidoreductase [Sulfitobacter sp. SK012]AXI48469.1 amine oxidase [Sulfitobacter sp. SK012]